MFDFIHRDFVDSLVKLLKCFYEITIRISGSLYVTSNSFFSEISYLSCILADVVGVDVGSIKVMGANMMAKYDKY